MLDKGGCNTTFGTGTEILLGVVDDMVYEVVLDTGNVSDTIPGLIFSTIGGSEREALVVLLD